MIRRLGIITLLVVGTTATAPKANAQFTNACGGTNFFSCVNLAITGQGTATLLFTVTNVSNAGQANNPNSDFTLIGVGSSGTGPLSMLLGLSPPAFYTACTTALTGCTNSSSNYANGFQGPGFLPGQKFYGLDITGNNGLFDGHSASFFLSFATSGGATSFLNGLQLAIHDQGGLTEGCGSSKVVFNADGRPTSASSSPSSAGTCNGPPSTVPEPSSLALLGTGLIGLVPMVRKRRK